MTQPHATIIDVAPRDGLQNEPKILPVATRIELIKRLVQAGIPRIEIGSFVNPKQVPQMASMPEVCVALMQERATTLHERYTALIPNMRGYELAVQSGLRHVRLVLAASEALNQANFRRSVDSSLEDFASIAARARADNINFGVAIGASFGCPFEGHVPPERVYTIAQRLIELGADEIVLADTTGMAVPTQVSRVGAQIRELTDQIETTTIGVHFHNTRNTGFANAYAALQAGITNFDASLGGIGGCPFAPRAVGNIATEDLVHMLNGMGITPDINLNTLITSSTWLGEQMEKTLPALVGRAGPVYTDNVRQYMV